MPELPEVQTIVDDLNKKVIGAQIVQVIYTDEGKKLISKGDQDLSDILPGEKITRAQRRAKYLILNLSGRRNLIIHLKLTGQLFVRAQNYAIEPFTRLILKLDDKREIRFADREGYSEVVLADGIDKVEPNLGPEPFEISEQTFTDNLLATKLGTIKEALIDQKVISGIGNIYVDEALYLAKINPFRPPHSLSKAETQKLLRSIKETLKSGLEHRGTTIDSYRDTDGRPGTHQFHLLVYGKAGKPCKRCATRIEYTEISGRRTHFCPACQPKMQLSLF